MAKRLTPIIGLAVVVALAFAAVFGAMSLTNPAFAAVNSPASDQLAEKGFYPQVDDTVEIDEDDTAYVDITSYIEGGRSVVAAIGHKVSKNPSDATVVAGEVVVVNRTNVELSMMGAGQGRVRVTATIFMEDGSTAQTVTLTVNVVAAPESKAATKVGSIPDQKVGAASVLDATVTPSVPAAAGTATKLDVSDFFADGTGPKGGIEGYSVTSDTPLDVLVSADDGTPSYGTTIVSEDGKILLNAPIGSAMGGEAIITVTTIDGVPGENNDPMQTFFVDVVAPSKITPLGGPTEGLLFESGSTTPGKVTRYEFTLPLNDETNTLVHDMVIELEDYGFPSAVGTSSIVVSTTGSTTGGDERAYTFTPEDVDVSGSKLLISMGDITEDTGTGAEGDQGGIYMLGGPGHTVTVVIRSTSGISNPTEHGTFFANIEFGTNNFEYDEDDPILKMLAVPVRREVGLDEEDGGRGDKLTVTGKGFKNGTTVTFWRDKMTAVMWDKDNDMSTDMVRLMPMYKEDYEAAVKADPTRGSHMLPLPETENTEQWNHDGINRTPPVEVLVAPNGSKDSNEERLCSAVADGQDVASCKFEVTNPPFVGGDMSNYVNGVDGRGNTAHKDGDDDQRFLLLPSIAATPNGGSPGEVMLVQLADFPTGVGVDKVQLSRRDICGGFAVNASGNPITCRGSTDGSGNVNISVVIPNWAEPGKQELRVFTADDGDDNITVDISGPIITPTPRSVVANQRVSLVGSGFFAGAKIGDCDDCGNAAITIGGDEIAWPRINGNDDVNVDNGGNWSAAVDLPLTSATTAAGKRTIRVTDSKGRTGTVDITIPGREVSITPTIGRVGTEAVIRGSNFPSKNDDGDSFNVVIIYDAGNGKQATVTAVPDASGRFETPLRIPTTAGIPSTNTVKVEFDDSNDVKVVTTVTHDVPEGAIMLSEYSGAPGSKITILGEGFKAFVPVQSVKVGNIEVTPSPNPSTDGQGMLDFEVTIPGLDNGIQTVEVKVSGTTASEGFTVRPSGVSAGDIKASAEAIVNLGENFVRSFNFNNDTKSWTFYSPEAPDDSTQTNFITGESYWILIGESQQVILNGKTRNLTCASDNCWNQIVW